MGAVRENEIGLTRCRYCGSDAAAVRVSAKQLAYIMCNRCNLQTLARSDMSDELLRQSITEPAHRPAANDAGPPPAPVPATRGEPANDADKGAAPAPAPTPPAPAKPKGWGFLG